MNNNRLDLSILFSFNNKYGCMNNELQENKKYY